ncbi:alpha/beta fold hydrolase, partial [Micromonospora sp. D75]|uniref:alpha/beta hydrolase n=1 Tax=Micromonospora sp. D75 TaxID=2824885 RepID=UPI001B384606
MRSPVARIRRALAGRPRRIVAVVAVVVLVAAALVWVARPQSPDFRTESALVTVRSGPSGDEPVELDTTLYLPDRASEANRVPAVLLAHGFGGTKDSARSDAEDLAARGYAVLTWTARGFGRSGGQIHLDSPDYEVRDAQRLLDRLAARPDIRLDSPGDPRVGVVGGSYGGGLALLLAAQDQRVDAIVPMITGNDLSRAFLPESTGRQPTDGVFKKGWAGIFFGGGGNAGSGPAGLSGATAAAPEGAPESAGPPSPQPGAGPGTGSGRAPAGAADPSCGRFAADVCAAYLRIATTGRADAAAVELLRRSSPAGVLDRIKSPTLLVQGEADTLFPLAEADANARGIAAAGTPVRV